MQDIRRRRTPDAVWIPLRVAEHIEQRGKSGYLGFREEFFGLGSVAIPMDRRGEAQKLHWSDIGLGHDHGVWATADYYKPAEIYQYNDRADLGTALVLEQAIGSGEPHEWHLNQDLVFALGLKREGDIWVRPMEDYCPVAQLRRDSDGQPVAIEIKNEFLRDYLCARRMFVRMSSYRQREIIVDDASKFDWPDGEMREVKDGDRFELRVIPIIEGGHLEDGGFAVFHMGRTDVDPEEDVPRPGPESEAAIESRSWTGKHKGQKLYRVMGELWRDEEMEPAAASERVRGDTLPTGIQYIVDAAGQRLSSEALDNEDDPRWLWFRPEVIAALIRHRGGELLWYTRETGGVSCSPGYSKHFGINSAGLVTVYAEDIVKLPTWQQRIWAGYNIAPEGKVSKELLSAQMAGKVAHTTAPEQVLPEVLVALDDIFRNSVGFPLFRAHASTDALVASIHRFRALEPGGVFALAKDLMRLTSDRIDKAALQKIVPPAKGEDWGSLKSLEKYLATIVAPDVARRAMGPLAGANELRIADAHIPARQLEDAFKLAGVSAESLLLDQGMQLIESVTKALIDVDKVMLGEPL